MHYLPGLYRCKGFSKMYFCYKINWIGVYTLTHLFVFCCYCSIKVVYYNWLELPYIVDCCLRYQRQDILSTLEIMSIRVSFYDIKAFFIMLLHHQWWYFLDFWAFIDDLEPFILFKLLVFKDLIFWYFP